MKTMKLIAVLFVLTFAIACGQTKPDNTFQKPMYFPYGIYIGTDTNLHLTWPTGSESVTWDNVLFRPLLFPPIAHTHDYTTDLTKLPVTIELQAAISQLRGIIPPRYTTAQINAFTLPIEEGLEIYDLTLHVKKYWNGTKWQIIITAN